VGVEVEDEAVVAAVEGLEQVPLVPPDPGLALGEREDVDADHEFALALGEPEVEA